MAEGGCCLSLAEILEKIRIKELRRIVRRVVFQDELHLSLRNFTAFLVYLPFQEVSAELKET